MKLIYVFIVLALVQSKEDAANVNVIDYQSMYTSECTTTPPSAAATSSAPIPSTSTTPAPVHGWKKYEDKYGGGQADKHDSNSEQQQTATFCKCLAEEKKSGKSYADSQNDFSKCIDKADGNDAQHWERIARKYAQKYDSKEHKWGNLPEFKTTTIVAILVAVNNDSEDTAFYVTFIGSSVLLFICVWFAKQSFNKWHERDYEKIGNDSGNFQRSSNRFAAWNQYSSV